MAEEYYVEPCEFTCAKKFLDALDETNDRWRRETWLFRGQNVDKCLLPSAMRQTAFTRSFSKQESQLNHSDEPLAGYVSTQLNQILPYFQDNRRHSDLIRRFMLTSSLESLVDQTNGFPHRQFKINHQMAMERSLWERLWVRAFINLADQVGLKVPRDSFSEIWNKPYLFPDLAEISVKSGKNLTELDPDEFTSIGYALARHHRVPTRLLDFTYRPQVAAFFAAYADDNRNRQDAEGHIIVWAVSQTALGDTDLKIVKHRRGEIGFLQSQQGAFLLDTRANEKYWFAGDWLPFEYYLIELVEQKKAFKFALPFRRRRKLLKLLELKGVNVASLMPSFDNVWSYLRDDQSDFLGFAMG